MSSAQKCTLKSRSGRHLAVIHGTKVVKCSATFKINYLRFITL